MLEEALNSDDDKHQPTEAALAMLSFVQVELSAGGAAAEARFYRLYGPLCERIFGPIQSAQEEFRHKDTGWLCAQSPWKRSMSTVPSSPQPMGRKLSSHASVASSSTSLESDPIVKLLCTSGKLSPKEQQLPTLVEAVSSEEKAGVSFRLPLHALPKVTQDAWLALLEAALGGKPAELSSSENHTRLLRSILRKPPEEQTELLLYKQKSAQKQQVQPLQLSPRGFSSPMMKKPTSASPGKEEDAQEISPNAMLSMLEYYLFLFVRFPLAAPVPKQQSAYTTTRYRSHSLSVPGSRSRDPYGEQIYYHLFRKYLRHFLPHEREGARSIDFSAATRESELFLRTCIALWIESHTRVTTTSKVIQSISERRHRAGIVDPPSYDLNVSSDLVQAKYEPLPSLVPKCLRNLVIHLVLDPALYNNIVEKNLSGARSCLGSSMTAMQQPFYNYLRATLRNAPIHASDSPFFAAFNMWLMWMEPWNLNMPKKNEFSPTHATQRIIGSVSRASTQKPPARTLSIPRYGQASRYNPAWEAYIAANLYIYTVPLAIFLRRARELDFSAGKFDKSVEIVKRVFRIFSPPVVDALSRHLNGSAKFSHLTAVHVENLGPYAMPQGLMSLSSCQSDMRSLLEEIHSQHTKKVQELDIFQAIGAKLEGLFGVGVVSGEEKALEGLEDRARLIVHLPIDFDFIPGTSSGSSSTEPPDSKLPSRNKEGLLSGVGQQQLMTGQAKCNPVDVSFVGDKLRGRIGSHEISLFVDLTIWASDWANEKLGLDKKSKGSFRVNVRFLADYRNILFLIVLVLIGWGAY